jgi:hypothetical protein
MTKSSLAFSIGVLTGSTFVAGNADRGRRRVALVDTTRGGSGSTIATCRRLGWGIAVFSRRRGAIGTSRRA